MARGNPQQGLALLRELTAKIPRNMKGEDKQTYLSKQLIGKLTDEERDALRSVIEHILEEMLQRDASDMDLGSWGSNGMVWLRIHGKKRPLESLGQLKPDESDILIQNVFTNNQRSTLIRQKNLDLSFTLRDMMGKVTRFRMDAYYELNSLALNMRAIKNELRPFQTYNFHMAIQRVLSLNFSKEGVILVTGITGSGKSATLDAIIDYNNASIDGHIIIIASPVEYIHKSRRCIVRHREVGRDTRSFKDGTIEALRQDPDIIVIGEMRDPETIMAALEVADSGHKVFSTLHTSSAIESIARIVGEIPSEEQYRVVNRLADVLRCVISQKLVPSIDGKRVLAKEILVVTPSVKAAIKNNNTNEIYQMINEGGKLGMSTMEQDLKRLVSERKITQETAMNYSNNKRMMQRLLKAM